MIVNDMKAKFTVRQALAAVGGEYAGPEEALDREVTFVTSDSRAAAPGCVKSGFAINPQGDAKQQVQKNVACRKVKPHPCRMKSAKNNGDDPSLYLNSWNGQKQNNKNINQIRCGRRAPLCKKRKKEQKTIEEGKKAKRDFYGHFRFIKWSIIEYRITWR